MLTAIRNWVVQTMMKGQTGVVRTLPKPQIIELNTQITAERMLRNGINPNDMKTVGQVENVVKQIDTPKVNVNPGVTGVKKAPVFDMEGNKIPEGSGIMGGKAVKESDAAIKARIQADNEKGLASMKKNLEDPEEKADGGRIGLLAGSVPKISAAISAVLKNKKKVQQAVDNIFPTGDYKYDAEMAADALVELNPKDFNNLLREDLSDEISSEIYGAVLKPIMSNMAEMRELRKLSKPEKTLQSMKEGKGIDISDPEIADEFTTFMKERDPKGYKKLEQTVELSNFKTKGRKKNSDGGRIGLKGAGFINFIKNMTMNKKSPLQFGKDYLKNVKDKTLKANETGKFMDLPIAEVGIPAATGALVNNQIRKKLENMNEAQKEENLKMFIRELENDEFYDKYPDIKDEMIADYTERLFGVEKADGGRIGYKTGSVDKMRRLILKAMGAGTVGIGAAKSGIFSGLGKGAGKTVAKEVVQQTTSSTPPPYFFKLAEKIKLMGADATATTDRTIAKSLKSKDGKSEYLLEQDVSTGDTIIKKINKEGDEMITDVQIMEFRKGEDVVTKDGKAMKTPDEYEEVTEANARIEGDVYNDPYYSDGIEEIEMKKIIDEVDDKVPSIKYASGGLAYMLGE